MLKEAVNFMHLLLLRDLTPPWVTQQFPQALPGDGLLSKFTRPSFLCWPEADADVLFGTTVSGVLRRRAGMVQKEFAGVIARPLYQCTALVDGHMCSKVASMSRFMQNPEGRPPYRCNDCAARVQGADDAPTIAGGSLRAILASCAPQQASKSSPRCLVTRILGRLGAKGSPRTSKVALEPGISLIFYFFSYRI